MRSVIDLYYSNGEVQKFCDKAAENRKYLEFHLGVEHTLDFRFCNELNSPVEIIPSGKFGRAQLLLSSRDRLLASEENNISFGVDDSGFQVLHVEKLSFDSPAIRQQLAASQWELEPDYRGKIFCDFSMAIYINEYFRTSIQLFFTLEAVLKQ